MPPNVTVEPVPPADRQAALQLLGIAASRAGHLLAAAERGELNMDGLWRARRGDRLVGAAWGQPVPGGTAFCWTPQLCDEEPYGTALDLQTAVDTFLDGQAVHLIQATLSTQDEQPAQTLVAAGYRYLTTLQYLACNQAQFPRRTPRMDVDAVHVSAAEVDRWAQVLARTYDGSLDCEQLDTQRALSDVIIGYRNTGVYRPQWWLILRHLHQDVGCLLLADHPELDQAELMYVGLVPEARGRGWGVQVTRYAQWLAAQAQRDRIVLAVDVRNWPARNMYAETHFYAWDQRCVYVRTPPRQPGAARQRPSP